MNFMINKDNVVELSGKREFAGEYLKSVQDHHYALRHDEENVWQFLEIEEVGA